LELHHIDVSDEFYVGQDLAFLVKTGLQPCQSNKHFDL